MGEAILGTLMETHRREMNPTPLVFAALAALAWAVVGISFAMLAPPHMVPRLFYSLHIEHFAAFYVVALIGAAALPSIRLHYITAGLVGLALILEAVRMIAPTHRLVSAEDLFCDVAGIWAALVPILVGRLRDSYAHRNDVRPPA